MKEIGQHMATKANQIEASAVFTDARLADRNENHQTAGGRALHHRTYMRDQVSTRGWLADLTEGRLCRQAAPSTAPGRSRCIVQLPEQDCDAKIANEHA